MASVSLQAPQENSHQDGQEDEELNVQCEEGSVRHLSVDVSAGNTFDMNGGAVQEPRSDQEGSENGTSMFNVEIDQNVAGERRAFCC